MTEQATSLLGPMPPESEGIRQLAWDTDVSADAVQPAQDDDLELELFEADGPASDGRPPLRVHQQRAWQQLQDNWAAGQRRQIAVAPTGAGKSRLGAEAADAAERPLCIVHTRPLAKQNAANICRTVTVQSICAAARRGDADLAALLQAIGPVDLVILDEGHHYVSKDPEKPHEGLDWGIVHRLWPDARLLSLTATPCRDDGTPLRPYYDSMVVVASYTELVEAGHLVPGRVIYDAKVETLEKGARLQRWERGDVVQAYLDECAGLSSFIFCESCVHARETAEKLNAAGVTSVCVDGSTSDTQRDEIFDAFERRDVMVLTTVDVLTEGVDLPLCEAIVLFKAFSALSAFIQACGRGLRAYPGKDECLVYDMSGCTKEFGFPHDDRDYSLDGNAITKAGGYVLLCDACMRGFGIRGTPPRDEKTGEIDLTQLNSEDGTGAVFRSEIASVEHVEKTHGVVTRRIETIETMARLTAAERKTRSKTAKGSIGRMQSYLGALVWFCAPSKTGASPCPHCARDRPRGNSRAQAAKRGKRGLPPLEGPRTARNAVEQIMRHLMAQGKDLSASADLFWQYFPEANGKVPASKIHAMVGRVWREVPELDGYQREWLEARVVQGWNKGVWLHRYERFARC